MRDPFRLRVLKALAAQIETVTPAGGYRHDLARWVDEDDAPRRRVFRGRSEFSDGDPLPLVSILEDPRGTTGVQPGPRPGVRLGDWQIIVQGFARDDPEDPTDPAHVLAAEVARAIVEANPDSRDLLGEGHGIPCVRKLTLGSPVVRPPESGLSDVAFFLLPITLSVAEDLTKPFD